MLGIHSRFSLKSREREAIDREMVGLKAQLLALYDKDSVDEFLQHTLDVLERSLESPIGAITLYSEVGMVPIDTIWSSNTKLSYRYAFTGNGKGKGVGTMFDFLNPNSSTTLIINDFSREYPDIVLNKNHPQIYKLITNSQFVKGRLLFQFTFANRKRNYTTKESAILEFMAEGITQLYTRKIREIELSESKQNFQDIFENHAAPKLLVASESGKIISVNHATTQLYGWRAEDMRQMTLYELLSSSIQIEEKDIMRLIRRRSFITTQKHRQQSGATSFVELYGSRMTIGKEDTSHIIIHDITEKYYREQIQNILFNTENHLSIHTPIPQFFEQMERQLNTLLEYESIKLLTIDQESGKINTLLYKDTEGFNPLSPQDTEQLQRNLIKHGRIILLKGDEIMEFTKMNNLNFEGIKATGCRMSSPIILDGQIKGLLILKHYTNSEAFTSISFPLMELFTHEIALLLERYYGTIELAKAKEEAEKSDKMKSAFIANMSHEIRTPLNTLLGFVDLIKEEGENVSKREEYFKVIKESAERLNVTMSNLIELSKAESGSLEFNRSTFRPALLFSNLVENYLPVATYKGVELILDSSIEMDFIISNDFQKYHSIVHNIVSNAIKFTERGSVVIKAYTNRESLIFAVSDTGIGIPHQELESLFIPFMKLSGKRRNEYQGTGVGLAITKWYLTVMGGKIEVVSKENEGSIFKVTLPLNYI